jgi:hypothetical protein
MTAMLHVLHRRRLDRSFSRALPALAACHLREHLATCAACQGRYERQLIAEAVLPDGEARAEERLWREIERVAALPAAKRERRHRPAWLLSLVLAAATAAAVVALVALPRAEDPVARGPAATGLPPSLHLFRVVGAGTEPVSARIHAGDGLLFAYSNPGERYSHLMVFAVDERGQVYWYYPAYQRVGDDPEAVPIEGRHTGVELREVIRQPLPPGRVRVYALFLGGPAPVSAVERALAAAGAARAVAEERAVLPEWGARQESWLLEVQP